MKKTGRRAAREAVAILVAATVIGLAVYAVRPDKINDRSAGSVPTGANSGLSVISVAEAFRLYQDKQALFADARHAVDFAAGHIKGAINLPPGESAVWLADFLAATQPQTMIVTYCDGESCHFAPELAELLYFNGFDHVFYLENGWTRWRENGYPSE